MQMVHITCKLSQNYHRQLPTYTLKARSCVRFSNGEDIHNLPCTHTHRHAHTHACTHTRTHSRTHARTHVHTHTYTQASNCTNKLSPGDFPRSAGHWWREALQCILHPLKDPLNSWRDVAATEESKTGQQLPFKNLSLQLCLLGGILASKLAK